MEQFPYLLEVQSDVFERSTRSIYIPLVFSESLSIPDDILNAEFSIEGKGVRLFPLDIASAPRAPYGSPVANLKRDSDRVVAALDLLFARF